MNKNKYLPLSFLLCLWTALLSGLAAAAEKEAPAEQRSIAITIDDLPFTPKPTALPLAQQGTKAILAALQKHRAKAIGFVNEDKLFHFGEVDARISLLDAWLDAGMELGNHNFGHLGLQKTPLADYQDAVIKGEAVTRQLLAKRGQVLRYYRHPMCQTGPTEEAKAAFERFLQDRGYRVAPMTIDHDDFVFDPVYADALQRQDEATAAKVKASYLAHLDLALNSYETMSRELFGRQIPQVLVIHANRINADSLDAMLTKLERRGYRFVTLDEALADPAYQSPDGFIGPQGPSWLLRWARGLGKVKALSVRGAPDPETWIQEKADALAAKH